AFLATPVFDGARVAGVFVLQMPVREINRIMADSTGLGATGETYLVGPDRLMRTDSRFRRERTLLVQRVDSEGARRSLAGETATAPSKDYRGEDVIASFAPLRIEGLHWGIVAKMDRAEIQAPIDALRRRVLVLTALLVVAAGGLLYLGLWRLVLRPVGAPRDHAEPGKGGDHPSPAAAARADRGRPLPAPPHPHPP